VSIAPEDRVPQDEGDIATREGKSAGDLLARILAGLPGVERFNSTLVMRHADVAVRHQETAGSKVPIFVRAVRVETACGSSPAEKEPRSLTRILLGT